MQRGHAGGAGLRKREEESMRVVLEFLLLEVTLKERAGDWGGMHDFIFSQSVMTIP